MKIVLSAKEILEACAAYARDKHHVVIVSGQLEARRVGFLGIGGDVEFVASLECRGEPEDGESA